MSDLCGKLVQKPGMAEPRPCLRPRTSCNGRHRPDLTGLHYHDFDVLYQGPDRIAPDGRHRVRWYVRDVYGFERLMLVESLYQEHTTGKRVANGSGLGGRDKNKKVKPEYQTVTGHWHNIFHSKSKSHKYYKDMPFPDEWNPNKGGSFWTGYRWIIDNLGPRPDKGWSMDIIKHELGFVPGNLRWAKRGLQRENQYHRRLGEFSLLELETEARRHGYKLKPIQKVESSLNIKWEN